MAPLTGSAIIAIVIVVILAVIVIALLLYLLRRLKSRKTQLLGELADRPELNQDRAFNRLAMARREARALSDQGVDVQRAQELIAESQGAFDLRHFDRAYETAQSAHEALVTARQKGSRSTGVPLPSSAVTAVPGPVASGAGPAAMAPHAPSPLPSESSPAPRPTIPKNQVESQFQIHLLTEELEALPARRARDPSGLQAAEWKRLATVAFAKADYTEAFRLALKGRRALGGSVESLPPSPVIARPASPEPANGTGPTPDLTATAETVAGGERCPECGYPALAGDAFCRGCGRPRGTMTCPTCGAPRGAEEPFCGRCGTRFP